VDGGSSPVSSLRTGTTAALWAKRLELEAYKKGATKPQTELLSKQPKDSHINISLPVASDPVVRSQYLNFRGGLRFGKLLEDIDAFAGNVAFLHCDDARSDTTQHTLVTACVDRVDVMRPITLHTEDLVLQGCASWAGRSSLEISVKLHRAESMEAVLKGSVVFVSVGGDGKGVAINPVVPESEEDHANFKAGGLANEKRRQDRKTSLRTQHPSEDETMLLHKVMMDSSKQGEGLKIGETMLQTTELMQPQEKNRSGKIFGGFLMREAYELAYTTASAFTARGAPGGAGGGGGVLPRWLRWMMSASRCP